MQVQNPPLQLQHLWQYRVNRAYLPPEPANPRTTLMALQLTNTAPLSNPLRAPLAALRAFVAANEGIAHATAISLALATFIIALKLAGV